MENEFKLNYFERKAYERLTPYKYDNTLSVVDNARLEMYKKTIPLTEYPIVLIGLISMAIKCYIFIDELSKETERR